ncbi:CoA-binding protein [Thermodesulfobacteriota bacterium]
MIIPSLHDIRLLLTQAKTIAVVGLSPKNNRPSHQVAQYLIDTGYTVIPVNPGQDHILGLTCYPDLLSIPEPVDIVNIFRRSEDIPPIVDQAIAIQAAVVWMQQGIINQEAAQKAETAGIRVVMDKCIKVEHAYLL